MHKKQHIISLIVCICVLLGCFSYYPSVSAINASSNEATEATQKDFCGLSIDETTGNSEDTSETTVLPDFITSDQIKSDKIVIAVLSCHLVRTDNVLSHRTVRPAFFM